MLYSGRRVGMSTTKFFNAANAEIVCANLAVAFLVKKGLITSRGVPLSSTKVE